MAETRFKKGDQVIVRDHWRGPIAVRKVARAMRRFVELSDGSKYAPDGKRMYGMAHVAFYTGTSIERPTAATLRCAQRNVRLAKLRRVVADLPLDVPPEKLAAALKALE